MRRTWTLDDLAAHVWNQRGENARRRAMRFARDLESHFGVKLLERVDDAWRVDVAAMRRVVPDLFVDMNPVEFRLEALEESVATARAMHASMNGQSRANASALDRIRRYIDAREMVAMRSRGPRRVA